ncbi:hypothetical protein LPJ53_003639 [Coemansia erecta]|uniref:UDENN domain-containing protein n=1 Tax=Coemansia erecta TaxID=147472 RepID=A0A9W7XVV4_9FUNG|nr:hypothetical protein LPJ53_003639 [Coemansia erecta]
MLDVSAASSLASEDEFYDCKSHPGSAKPSLDDAGHKPQQQQQPRFRSLTNSRVPQGSTSPTLPQDADAAGMPPTPSTLRRSATASAKHSVTAAAAAKGKSGGKSGDSLVEERARRAVRAMAEACTTGVTVREADGRRARAFGRLLVDGRLAGAAEGRAARPLSPAREGARSSSNENLAMRARLRANPIHQVASHGRLAGQPADAAAAAAAAAGSASAAADRALAQSSSLPPEPDSRTLSMTDGRQPLATARSASLEARVDRQTRARLAQWLVCFATVQFDVDQGPTLSLLYPHVPFSDSERAAICFSSMPDSTIYELYDSVYTFHFRVDPVRLGLPKDRIFLYGHVFFRQKRDPLMRRGGFQRSVAVISHLPYHGLFSRMAHMLGPLYFDLGSAILEAAAHNVSSWPTPGPDAAYELPFLGTALSVELPARDASQLLETSSFPLDRFDPGEHILASVSFDGLFRSFRDTLGDLWTCWELMILGESLVVLADTPSRCSEAIVSLVDIIFPITYCGDYRPYFTIQDPDFRAVVSKTHVPPNTVVGVSNPFFSEALSHWPNKLFLGSSGRMSQMHGASARKARAFGDGAGAAAGGGNVGAGAGATDSSSAGGAGMGGAIKQGLQTRHRCAISKDRPFAELLLNALKTGKQPPWMVNNMLRRYFIDLTVQFLVPLNRYFSTLIPQVLSSTAIPTHGRERPRQAPWSTTRRNDSGGSQAMFASATSSGGVLQTELSWFVPPGNLRPWRTDDFMASLASFGISPQLSSRHNTPVAAADVFASVFSSGGSSSSSNSAANGGAAGGSSSSEHNVHGAGSSSASASASNGNGNGNGSSSTSSLQEQLQKQLQQLQQPAISNPLTGSTFSLWKSKKSGSKKVSDEWQQLYTQFLKCGNFATWLARRTNEAQRALLARFRQEVCNGDVHAWCRGYDYPLDFDEQQLASELEMLDLATMDLGQSGGKAGADGADAGQHLHAKHVFYHGEAEDERMRAERHRQKALRKQQERLARSEQPVYGSDGSFIGYTRRKTNPEQMASKATPSARGTAAAAAAGQHPQQKPHLHQNPHQQAMHSTRQEQQQQQQQQRGNGNNGGSGRPDAAIVRKQLGQRITHARRPQHVVLHAAWQIAELMGPAAMARIPLEHRAGSASVIDAEMRVCTPADAECRALRRQLSIMLEYMAAEEACLFLPLVADDYHRS